MKRSMHLAWLALLAAALLTLPGCNRSSSSNSSTHIRVVAAVADAEPLDLLVDDDPKVSDLPAGSVSGYVEVNSGTRGLKVRSHTQGTVLAARTDLERADFPQLSTSGIEAWAQEGVKLAGKVAYLDGALTGGDDEQDPFEMPDGFSALAQGVAEQQVTLAGYRMSDLLTTP